MTMSFLLWLFFAIVLFLHLTFCNCVNGSNFIDSDLNFAADIESCEKNIWILIDPPNI